MTTLKTRTNHKLQQTQNLSSQNKETATCLFRYSVLRDSPPPQSGDDQTARNRQELTEYYRGKPSLPPHHLQKKEMMKKTKKTTPTTKTLKRKESETTRGRKEIQATAQSINNPKAVYHPEKKHN